MEGMQLFSTFAILLNFSRFGLMKGMCTIVEWSIRDELLHCEGMTWLFRQFIKENPEIWTDEFKKEIYEICRHMVKLEDRFIDLMFKEAGEIPGITADEVKKYIRFIADRRLADLGLKANYHVKENPLSFMDWMIMPSHDNFFEKRVTEYSKAGLEWSDDAFDF
jgi:ribonucleoside-diphosphate reductase beta chain